MEENNLNVDQPEQMRINLDNDNYLKVWSQVFDVTPGELQEAVEQVGPIVVDVERYIKSYIKPGEKY